MYPVSMYPVSMYLASMYPVSSIPTITVPRAPISDQFSGLAGYDDAVIKDYLKIDPFIERHKSIIFPKLEQNFQFAKGHDDASLLFVAYSLPTVFGVVHLGSTSVDFQHAKNAIREKYPNVDHESIFSILTLAYIIKKGHKEFPESDTWRSMHEQMQSLLKV